MSAAAERDMGASPLRVSLGVPHHWQLSEHWDVRPEDIRRICAPVCLKTLLDYMFSQRGETGPALEEIIRTAMANGGRTENGWSHAAEVATLKDFGLNAWRRDWGVSDLSAGISRRREGYDQTQTAAVENQRRAEAILGHPAEKARLSILTSLFEQNPVIASVAPGFSENKASHQIVIHGYEEDSESVALLVTDPIVEDKSHQERLVAWDYFAAYFNQRAIFVEDTV